jgi:hypothetical protein
MGAIIHSLAERLILSETNVWKTFVAVIPCFNSHADAIEHRNSFHRCVTTLTISFVVIISTVYYQTLLLSSCLVKNDLAPPLSMQEIVHNCVGHQINRSATISDFQFRT